MSTRNSCTAAVWPPVVCGDRYKTSVTTTAENVRELRLLIQHERQLRRFCKLVFTKKDASVYLVPYAATGRYFYGSRLMPEERVEETFNFREQLTADAVPKLSLHERGQVHAYAGAAKAGPLTVPPLSTLTGQHVASISADAFAALPLFEGEPREQGAGRDLVMPVEDGVDSGRIAICVNGYAPAFAVEQRLYLTLTRPHLRRPLYVGLAPCGQLPMGENDFGGVTVIAGWNPIRPAADTDFLYIRGV
jgi:hypothetical protein